MACPTQIFRAEKGSMARRATKERSLLSRVGGAQFCSSDTRKKTRPYRSERPLTELASRPMACPTQIFRAEKGNVQRRLQKKEAFFQELVFRSTKVNS